MELCDDDHETIVFEGGGRKSCPLCHAYGEIKEEQDLVDELNEQIEKLEAAQTSV